MKIIILYIGVPDLDPSNAVPTSDSLLTLIDQALQSGDDALLEQCLACTDVDVIEGTTKALKANRG